MMEKYDVNKTIIAVIGLNMIQIVALLGIIVYTWLADSQNTWGNFDILFGMMILIVSFNSFITMRDRRLLKKIDSQYNLLKETLHQVEYLNHTLRAQRHDFLNHLQVVYGLIEMNEYNDARDYIDKVYCDIQKVSKVLKTTNPAVNALIQAKMLACEKKDITLDLKITSKLSNLSVPSWEICRVLGNLIDNSIDVLVEKENEDRRLIISIHEDLKYFFFLVKNNGAQIPSDKKEIIFHPGFTTKVGKGQGMGLAISMEIVQKYHGSIAVDSDENETSFEVRIPIKNETDKVTFQA